MTNDIMVVKNTEIQTVEPTVNGLFDVFMSYLQASEKTKATYTRALRQYSRWINDNNIVAPTRKDVIAWLDSLAAEHKAPTTIASYLSAVKQLYKFAADAGLYDEITRNVKAPLKVDTDVYRKDALSAGQAAICLDKIETDTSKGRRDYTIFLLMSTCGLRCIEVQRADIEDLRTAGGKTVLYVQGKGKTEKTRFVVVPQEVEAAIRASLADRKNVSGSAPLFTSDSNHNAGGRLTTRSISRIAKGRMIDAGFNSDRLTAHSLRHCAVDTAISEGESLEAAQTFARHSDPKTTMIYVHSRERVDNSCSQTVYKAISRQRNKDKVRARREQQAAAEHISA